MTVPDFPALPAEQTLAGVLPCLVCGTALHPACGDDGRNQPKATMFVARGNYGSGVFDPMGGTEEFLQVNICDGCTVRAAHQGRVMHGVPRFEEQPVTRTIWVEPGTT